MTSVLLESKLSFPINIDNGMIINRYQEYKIVETTDEQFSKGILDNIEVKNDSLFLKTENEGFKGVILDNSLKYIGLANKTETGWEFEVNIDDLIVEKLRFLNLSEYSTVRRVNLWDSLSQKLIATTIIRADKKSWGYGDIEPVSLQKNKRYTVSIGAYNYSVYTRNISSDIVIDTNRISFIGPRYVSNKLDSFPNIDTSKKLYALPDIVVDSNIEYYKIGQRTSRHFVTRDVNNINGYQVSWIGNTPNNTSIKMGVYTGNIWNEINNGEFVPISKLNSLQTRQILISDGNDTPQIDEVEVKIKGYKKINKFELNSIVESKFSTVDNSIKKSSKVDEIKFNIDVRDVFISNKIFDSKEVFEINVKNKLDFQSNNLVYFKNTIDSRYTKIISEDVKLDTKVETYENFSNFDLVNFDVNVESNLLKSEIVIWEENRTDFFYGMLDKVFVSNEGLELEHWNPQYITEDFNDDVYSFNFIGDWERVYWDQNRGYVYRSKEISSNQISSTYFEFKTPNNSVDVAISFDYFISSEKDRDRFTVLIDSQPLILTGDLGWQHYEDSIESGYHRVEFIYRKNEVIDSFLDRACIDKFCVSYQFLRPSGYRISLPIDLSSIEILQTSKISWDVEIPKNKEAKFDMEISLDNGKKWTFVENGKPIPSLSVGDNLKNKSLIMKQNLYSSLKDSPILKSVKVEMMGFRLV